MTDLAYLARVSKLRGDAEMRAADYFRDIDTEKLVAFAGDVMTGEPLDAWVFNGSVDELLRALSYATLVREICRREEIAALEDEA
jgi:hypothetical protein